MNNLKQILIDYHSTLNWRGIEKELKLPPWTIKKWVYQDTIPAQDTQEKILRHFYKIMDMVKLAHNTIGEQEKEPTPYYIECPNCKKKIIENTPVCYYCETEF